jgi:hypothetical protein
MSDTTRLRAWRQRRKDAGLIAVTLWLQPETKARYEDLALTHRRSLSELAQLALDAYRLDPAIASDRLLISNRYAPSSARSSMRPWPSSRQP